MAKILVLVWLGILLPLTACGPGKMVSQASEGTDFNSLTKTQTLLKLEF